MNLSIPLNDIMHAPCRRFDMLSFINTFHSAFNEMLLRYNTNTCI